MTRKEFRKDVAATAKHMLAKHGLRWQDIVINHKLPYIAIGENIFFTQGEDAQQFIDEIPDDINEKSWILYYLDSAGAL